MNNALHILQHSIGVDEFGQGEQYRNRFVTSPGDADHQICMELVAQGLMARRDGKTLPFGGSDCFYVTEVGKQFVAENSPKPPKLSRSKQRYNRYLEYGDSFDSFIDFCRWDAEPDRSWNTRGVA